MIIVIVDHACKLMVVDKISTTIGLSMLNNTYYRIAFQILLPWENIKYWEYAYSQSQCENCYSAIVSNSCMCGHMGLFPVLPTE